MSWKVLRLYVATKQKMKRKARMLDHSQNAMYLGAWIGKAKHHLLQRLHSSASLLLAKFPVSRGSIR